MCQPSPPPAPDYAAAAKQQGSDNLAAAQAQGRINNPNVISPYGTQIVSWDADTPTITQQFSPEQQALYDQSNATKLQLGELGGTGATALQSVIGQNLDLSGLPTAPGGSTATRQKVYDAMMGRVNEDTAIQRDDLNSNLVAAGIRPGSKAYDDRMQLVNRGYNDARNQAELSSGQEASRDFGIDTQMRKDALAELLAQRQTPLNEVNSVLSGSQVSNPFAVPGYAQNAQVQPAPSFAASQAVGNWDTGVYNAKAAQQGNLTSGLFSLGGAGLMGGLPLLKPKA